MRLVSIELVKEAASEVARRYLGVQGAIEVRNRLILEALKDGVPQAELAEAAGLSQQRISQLVYHDQEDDNGNH